MTDVLRENTTASPSKPAADADSGSRVRVTVDGLPVTISPYLEAAILREALGTPATARANGSVPKEMSPTQAAEFLDVSRSDILKLIKRGELPCRMEGQHRRIPTEALLEKRKALHERARVAAAEITAISQELGLYEVEPPPISE